MAAGRSVRRNVNFIRDGFGLLWCHCKSDTVLVITGIVFNSDPVGDFSVVTFVFKITVAVGVRKWGGINSDIKWLIAIVFNFDGAGFLLLLIKRNAGADWRDFEWGNDWFRFIVGIGGRKRNESEEQDDGTNKTNQTGTETRLTPVLALARFRLVLHLAPRLLFLLQGFLVLRCSRFLLSHPLDLY